MEKKFLEECLYEALNPVEDSSSYQYCR
uniref:Twinfilin isoform x1 n=1 Tax=Triatoma infestans TaxID=30076 RepID=A0A170UJ29_TRIIF